MKFIVDQNIFQKWPGVRIGVLVILGMKNTDNGKKILELLRGEEKKQNQILQSFDFRVLPQTAGWQEIYRQFGSKPRDYRSSVEALLRRVRTGNSLPLINPLVDLYNYLSIKHYIPAGAEDLDKVKGDIELTFAKGDEKGRYIGAEEEDTCYPGEVIYKDNSGFICRRWNWREGDRTKIEEKTQNAVLVLEALPSITEEKFKEILKETETLVKGFLGGQIISKSLSVEEPVLEVDFQTGTNAGQEASGKNVKVEAIKKKTEKNIKTKSEVLLDKESLRYKLAESLLGIVQQISGISDISLVYSSFEHPGEESHGDYSTNVALISTKSGSPKEMAEKIKALWEKEGLPEFVEKIEIAGPGFLNIWLNFDYLISQLHEVLIHKDSFGSGETMADKKMMVEFAHPNTHKELHIGHMRTLITGEALARVLSSAGAKVFRANYQGDIGPHVAKSIWGTQKIMAEQKTSWEEAEKFSLPQKAHMLGEGYVRGNTDYEANKEEIDDLNSRLYRKDPAIMPVYERTRRWSLEYYDTFYTRFYTKYDRLFFESEVFGPGKKTVEENVGKVFARSEGAIVFEGEKYGLHTRVFVTQDGNPTYEGKDMALGPLQFKAFPFDLNIHVVANEQTEYFKVVFKALGLLYPDFVGRFYHLPMGMVQLVGQKMSSRTGVIMKVDDLLNDVKGLLTPLIKEEGLKDGEKEEIAEVLTVASVKYSILKVSPTQNVLFDLEKSVSLSGNSGPYLQYTYARTQSVLGKSKGTKRDMGKGEKNPQEIAILRTLYKFPEVVAEAAGQYSPNLICNYLFDLAQKYNLFYDKHRIVGEKEEGFRLLLTEAIGQILKNGLNLLGIKELKKM